MQFLTNLRNFLYGSQTYDTLKVVSDVTLVITWYQQKCKHKLEHLNLMVEMIWNILKLIFKKLSKWNSNLEFLMEISWIP